jgi:hypothetical protein
MTSASARFRNIFGQMNHLKEDISWTKGLSNLADFLVWNPQSVLGVSKKQYVRQIIEWSLDPAMQDKTFEQIEKIVNTKLALQMDMAEQAETYTLKNKGICNAREAVRRLVYFSEDYLNKEFDIFLSLASDNYMDSLYSQFTQFNKGGEWSTHGNSNLFTFSTELFEMGMDNLAYNHTQKVLIANELKLNGGKNKDQILKYAFMLKSLIAKQFVDENTRLVLIFISGKHEKYEKTMLIDEEINFCQKNERKFHQLLREDVIDIAREMEIYNMSWRDIMEFNKQYMNDNKLCQVEQKLLKGFNESLSKKSFIHLGLNKLK